MVSSSAWQEPAAVAFRCCEGDVVCGKASPVQLD